MGREPAEHDLERLRWRFELQRHIVTGIFCVVGLVAATLPLLVVRDMVEAVAGKETNVQANIVVSLTATLSLVGNCFQYVKNRSHASELRRLRAQVRKLEEHFGL